MQFILGAARKIPAAAIALLLCSCNANNGFTASPGVPASNPVNRTGAEPAHLRPCFQR